MNVLRASDKLPVHIFIAVVGVGIAVAATLAADDPQNRFWQCIFVTIVSIVILFVLLIQCIRSCKDDTDRNCGLRCVAQFVLILLVVLLFYVFCILRG